MIVYHSPFSKAEILRILPHAANFRNGTSYTGSFRTEAFGWGSKKVTITDIGIRRPYRKMRTAVRSKATSNTIPKGNYPMTRKKLCFKKYVPSLGL